MKIVASLLAIVALVNTAEIQSPSSRAISDSLQQAIDGIQQQMACGFPALGVPPVAPFERSHQDVNIDTPAFRLKGTMDNFRIENLDNFVSEVKVNMVRSIVSYRFDFRDIRVVNLYDCNLFLKKYGFTVDMFGNGNFDVTVKNVVVWGESKYSLGIRSRKLQLKTLRVHIGIGEVDSDIDGILGDGGYTAELNEIVSKTIPAFINANDQFISETIESQALPLINAYLDQHKLEDLIPAGGGETTKCEP